MGVRHARRMTRLMQHVVLLAFPHGGQAVARRNARTPVARYGDGVQSPVTNSRTARPTSTSANSLRRAASD